VRILNRLPYSSEPTTVGVLGDAMRVRPYQIVVWVSLDLRQVVDWDPRAPRFPAILDTGHSHNFSIRVGHLTRWAGLRPEALPRLGAMRERGQRVPLHAARLWLHANVRGTRDLDERDPYHLAIEEGIAIYPDETGPRLPVLGLRALTLNRLRSVVDGDRRYVTLSTALPRWWPFG
jgi:hypothetical protein